MRNDARGGRGGGSRRGERGRRELLSIYSVAEGREESRRARTCVAPVAVFVNVGSVEKTLSSRILPHCVQQLRERRGRDGQNRWSRARIHSSARRTK